MRFVRPVALVACAVILCLSIPAAADHGALRLKATKNRYLDSQNVVVKLVNNTGSRIEMLGGSIRDARSGERMVRLRAETRFLRADERHRWTWLHRVNPGRYIARFRTSVGRFTDEFEIGAYFQLGFRCEDTGDCDAVDPFVFYVTKEKPIRQLRNDLERPAGDRRIVSGIVQLGQPYNPHWSYVMGPGSIVLGEVFIETCDAHPQHVEDNRDEWLGDRWCPWSSYVQSEGR